MTIFYKYIPSKLKKILKILKLVLKSSSKTRSQECRQMHTTLIPLYETTCFTQPPPHSHLERLNSKHSQTNERLVHCL